MTEPEEKAKDDNLPPQLEEIKATVEAVRQLFAEYQSGPGKYRHFILQGQTPVGVDLLTWARWFEGNRQGCRVLRQETIGDYWVSTVFIGIDMSCLEGPPVLFETMVFLKTDASEGSKRDRESIGGCDRYSTWDEAMAGHREICERLKEFG